MTMVSGFRVPSGEPLDRKHAHSISLALYCLMDLYGPIPLGAITMTTPLRRISILPPILSRPGSRGLQVFM